MGCMSPMAGGAKEGMFCDGRGGKKWGGMGGRVGRFRSILRIPRHALFAGAPFEMGRGDFRLTGLPF